MAPIIGLILYGVITAASLAGSIAVSDYYFDKGNAISKKFADESKQESLRMEEKYDNRYREDYSKSLKMNDDAILQNQRLIDARIPSNRRGIRK